MTLRATPLAVVTAALLAWSWGVPRDAVAQPAANTVRLDSVPSRATLVCEGVVVGVTPLAVDPSRLRACSLHADRYAPLALDPDTLDRAIVVLALTPNPLPGSTPDVSTERTSPLDASTEPTPTTEGDRATPQGAGERSPRRTARPSHNFDPETGLMIPEFGTEDPVPSVWRPPPRPDPTIPRPASQRPPRLPDGPFCCGGFDPYGLLVPCFGDEPRCPNATRRPRRNTARSESPPPRRGPPRCGRDLTPDGLMIPCFDDERPPTSAPR